MDGLIDLTFILVLSVFLGLELIRKIPAILHTPLMSGTNAISGITLIGALITAGRNAEFWSVFLGFLAVFFATVNVVGGYVVTDRMLAMFKKTEKKS